MDPSNGCFKIHRIDSNVEIAIKMAPNVDLHRRHLEPCFLSSTASKPSNLEPFQG